MEKIKKRQNSVVFDNIQPEYRMYRGNSKKKPECCLQPAAGPGVHHHGPGPQLTDKYTEEVGVGEKHCNRAAREDPLMPHCILQVFNLQGKNPPSTAPHLHSSLLPPSTAFLMNANLPAPQVSQSALWAYNL